MPVPLDPDRQLSTLARHGVEFVLIGGLAGVLHGSPATTNDADICPHRAHDNLTRLAAALTELDAKIRTHAVPEGLPFDRSAAFLDNVDLLNMTTAAGDLDISYRPAGTDGYLGLAPRAVTYDVAGYPIQVASLDDIIHSKRTANRPKDHATLYILEALRDELT